MPSAVAARINLTWVTASAEGVVGDADELMRRMVIAVGSDYPQLDHHVVSSRIMIQPVAELPADDELAGRAPPFDGVLFDESGESPHAGVPYEACVAAACIVHLAPERLAASAIRNWVREHVVTPGHATIMLVAALYEMECVVARVASDVMDQDDGDALIDEWTTLAIDTFVRNIATLQSELTEQPTVARFTGGAAPWDNVSSGLPRLIVEADERIERALVPILLDSATREHTTMLALSGEARALAYDDLGSVVDRLVSGIALAGRSESEDARARARALLRRCAAHFAEWTPGAGYAPTIQRATGILNRCINGASSNFTQWLTLDGRAMIEVVVAVAIYGGPLRSFPPPRPLVASYGTHEEYEVHVAFYEVMMRAHANRQWRARQRDVSIYDARREAMVRERAAIDARAYADAMLRKVQQWAEQIAEARPGWRERFDRDVNEERVHDALRLGVTRGVVPLPPAYARDAANLALLGGGGRTEAGRVWSRLPEDLHPLIFSMMHGEEALTSNAIEENSRRRLDVRMRREAEELRAQHAAVVAAGGPRGVTRPRAATATADDAESALKRLHM
jgi:hypothetical protein